MYDNGLIRGQDGQTRCFWVGTDPLYLRYHDKEWGKPVSDDIQLFEKICLEVFQAGLSWLTVLHKREKFRAAFNGFDFRKIAFYDGKDIECLMADKGIIRHRGKIVSVINNAKQALQIVEKQGSLAAYFWSFEPSMAERFKSVDFAILKTNPMTAASKRFSEDLKKHSWTFVGPIIVYAFMQASGMVNDHIEGCYCRRDTQAQQVAFIRPC
ncbi:MAG: DNA-3-methyladenine glycosylase I [Candidatus Tokpelaia sp. JSC189]|nr:MAG: DNA-3-methyladenine glycosylase I [Candidatus Tokpelaia sp. JSC189]